MSATDLTERQQFWLARSPTGPCASRGEAAVVADDVPDPFAQRDGGGGGRGAGAAARFDRTRGGVAVIRASAELAEVYICIEPVGFRKQRYRFWAPIPELGGRYLRW